FPTDRELVEEYRASRHTIREAVRRLQEEGLITRRRGHGSYRTPALFAQPLGTIYSLFQSIEDAGVPQTSVVVTQAECRDDRAAKVLGLPVDSPLFYLERTRLAADQPLALDEVWLPLPLAAPLLEANLSRTALYAELRDRCGVVPEEGVEQSRAVTLDRAAAVRLGLNSGDPAFEIDRRTWARGRPLEWRVTIVRGDRYVFRAEWSTPWEPTSSRLVRESEE
ncbi:MAG TPA: GntR family transcriptional regulator, partial [Longimicrobiales bacterium]|nr:GntR family transcriptional regulator [Longimicrobiales bacterium]